MKKNLYTTASNKTSTIKVDKDSLIYITGRTICNTFGLKLGKIYLQCDCPDEYKESYDKDVWIICEEWNEPIRCLAGEYIKL